MNASLTPLMGQAADAVSRVTYEWTRLQSFTEWWQKPLLVVVCAIVALIVFWMYRRDSVELRPGVGWLLLLLRIATFGGLLLFYLSLEKRTEKQVTHNSRAILLVDTSLSMGRRDAVAAAAAAQPNRIEQVVEELAKSPLLKDLRKTHDVSVFRFDQETQRIQSFGKLVDAAASKKPTLENAAQVDEEIRPYKLAAFVGALVFLLSGATLLIYRISQGEFVVPWLWGGLTGVSLLVALAALARINISYPRENLFVLLGLTDESSDSAAKEPGAENPPSDKLKLEPEKEPDWGVELQPRGTETRLGQAIKQLLDNERNTPLAGIVVYTDGGQNSGEDPKLAVELAKEFKIPLFTVGLGSDEPPINVRVARFDVPPRVFPGDGFKVTGFLQGEGLNRRLVTAELRSKMIGKGNAEAPWQSEGVPQQITLGKDGEEIPVTFDLPAASEIGKKTFQLRVQPPTGDSNPGDNQLDADLEVVERKSRTMLIAGGPTREYQFLRTQIKRGKDSTVDVLLQSATEGISQDAQSILSDFPRTKEEMFLYDTIVCFDPNWSNFDQVQIDLLEKWVGEQAGGLIVIAGPIHTEQLSQDDKLKKIKALYPVEFRRRFAAALDSGRYGSTKPSPIEFTRSGQEAEYLWIDDTGAKSRTAWNDFPGVYGYFEVQGPKPGASVLGYYADADSLGKQQLIYFAEQFYGAGRVFYMGSGEMWRLRPQSPGYFEQFYTKLMRHVSQGRLLRGSSRGSLLIERERYLLGSSVPVRAQLLNAQLDALVSDRVLLRVLGPDGKTLALPMTADPARKGAYVGQFTAQREGTYLLELEIPESGGEVLTKRIQSTVSDRELENPQRNTKLLKEIADGTGGVFYPGIPATRSDDAGRLLSKLVDRTERGFLPGQPDKDWQRAYLTWLLVGICGALCTEWMIRRLCKLA